MYVTRIPNRDSPPAVLLRESYREGGKVKSRTLANISDWPEAKIDSLRRVLAGETLAPLGAERFEITRALAHGHVAAVLGTVRRLGLDKALPKGPERRAKLILATIVARIIEPAAKLATARQLSEATAAHSLGAVLGLGEVDEDELYAALDLLGRSQTGVEKVLAQRHLEDGVLVLYDVTSGYLEGAAVRTRAIRLQPRSSPRPAADRLRPFVHAGGLPGRRRGLRGQSRRSEHACKDDNPAAAAAQRSSPVAPKSLPLHAARPRASARKTASPSTASAPSYRTSPT